MSSRCRPVSRQALGATALLLASLARASAVAEADRSQMGVPAFTILEGMVRFAAAGEADKVARSLALLGPVLAEHERAFGATGDPAERLRAADPAALARAVHGLVARDVVVLLRQLDGASSDRARTLVRTARLEWRLIEGSALADDLRVAESVAGGLRDVGEAVDEGALGEARAAVPGVARDLLQLFSRR